ncbi:ABC transporter permease [Chelativorans multitrophicus]|uniref:ABC transporter permease n=1 Tax=Chelativorans multitrophicus TaxID=449973 RepID=UPI0014082944|nr:ABC transporter permease [Chelativorans multitrophicus]
MGDGKGATLIGALDAGISVVRRPRRRAIQFVPRSLVLPIVLFLIVFFVLPLAENVFRSFDPETGREHYVKIFTDVYYLEVIAVTLALSLGVTVLCLLIAYPVSYTLVRHSGRWSGVLVFIVIAPLLTSIIMRSFSWLVLLSRQGLVNGVLLDMGLIDRPIRMSAGLLPVTIALVHVMIPFMVLSIAPAIQAINPRLEESARILGASRIRTFLTVTFPLSLDGVATGMILVFMMVNGSFVTLQILGGGAVQTLPLLIYQQFNLTRDFGFGAAMSNVLLAIAIICLWLQISLIQRRGAEAR